MVKIFFALINKETEGYFAQNHALALTADYDLQKPKAPMLQLGDEGVSRKLFCSIYDYRDIV